MPPMASAAAFRFDNSFARDLPGFYEPWQPTAAPAPRLLYLNASLADELGLDVASLDDAARAALFAGNLLPHGAEPLAQAYAGHQFGGSRPGSATGARCCSARSSTGTARRDIAPQGLGPHAVRAGRRRQGRRRPHAARVLIGEAMHALGIPTTRALAVAATGEPVYREHTLPGAVLTRVAASHLRVGTFEFYASRGDASCAPAGRLRDRPARPRLADAPSPSWRCSSVVPSARPPSSPSG